MPQTYHDFDTTNYPDKFPEAVKEQQEKYGAVGWYDWNKQNYGCKWDCDFDSFQYGESKDGSEAEITFYFDSPWTPGDIFFMNLQEMYPELNFSLEYIEPGCCFAGHGETNRYDETVEFYCDEYEDWTESPFYTEFGYDEMFEDEEETDEV